MIAGILYKTTVPPSAVMNTDKLTRLIIVGLIIGVIIETAAGTGGAVFMLIWIISAIIVSFNKQKSELDEVRQELEDLKRRGRRDDF